MGNAVKCPRCASLVDVTSFAPGSSVRCSDCGGMMRVPTGRTGINPAVKAPVATGTTSTRAKAAERATKTRTKAVAAVSKKESGTRMRQAAVSRNAAPRPKSKTGLYVLLGVAALALIIGGAVLFLGGPQAPPPSEAPPAPVVAKKTAPPVKAAAPTPPPAPPPPAPVEISAPAPRGGDEASKFNWEEALKQLRGGGGYDIEGRPEQVYFERVKKLGKPAYPHLIRYIDNEDPSLGRAAVALLNALTGQKLPLPNDGTKAKVKADWEAWLKANP